MSGYQARKGDDLPTYAKQLGIQGEQFQQKADIGVFNWEGKIAWFDIGVAALGKAGNVEDQAKAYADSKTTKYHQHIQAIREVYKNSPLYTGQWTFTPLIVNSLGVWEERANEILQKCASKLESRKQGLFIQLWRQQLLVSLYNSQ